MKKIFTFICLLTALISEAQTLPTPPPGFTRISAKYLWLGVYPPDTTFSKYGLGAIGDSVYWGNGTRWLNVSRGTAVSVLGIQSIQKIGSSFLLVGDSTFISTDVPYLYGWNQESGRLQYNKSFKTSITNFQDGDDTYFIDSNTIGNRHPDPTSCNNTSNIGLSHVDGLTYAYTSGIYNIACLQYTIDAGATFTLDDFDGSPGQFRSDEAILRAGQGVVILKGENSDDQVGGTVPLNPATDILLSIITINSDNQIITSPTSQTVYYDHLTGEWTVSANGMTINADYTTNPLAPSSKSIRITTMNNNGYLMFVAPSLQTNNGGKRFSFYLRHNATVANTRNFTLYKFNGNAQVSGSVGIQLTAQRGWDKTAARNNIWQLISISLDDLGGQDPYDRFRLVNTGTGGTVDIQVDSARVESGVTTAPPPTTNGNFLPLTFNFNQTITTNGNGLAVRVKDTLGAVVNVDMGAGSSPAGLTSSFTTGTLTFSAGKTSATGTLAFNLNNSYTVSQRNIGNGDFIIRDTFVIRATGNDKRGFYIYLTNSPLTGQTGGLAIHYLYPDSAGRAYMDYETGFTLPSYAVHNKNTSGMVIRNNDTVITETRRQDYEGYAYFYNKTNGSSCSMNLGHVSNSVGQLVIGYYSAVDHIGRSVVYYPTVKNAKILIAGNSITTGASANGINSYAYKRIASHFNTPVVMQAGSAERTYELRVRKAEILEANCDVNILDMITNDPNTSVPIDTTVKIIEDVATALLANGKKVALSSGIANNNVSIKPYLDSMRAIASRHPGIMVIDDYNWSKDPGGTFLRAAIGQGDGTHLNDPGQIEKGDVWIRYLDSAKWLTIQPFPLSIPLPETTEETARPVVMTSTNGIAIQNGVSDKVKRDLTVWNHLLASYIDGTHWGLDVYGGVAKIAYLNTGNITTSLNGPTVFYPNTDPRIFLQGGVYFRGLTQPMVHSQQNAGSTSENLVLTNLADLNFFQPTYKWLRIIRNTLTTTDTVANIDVRGGYHSDTASGYKRRIPYAEFTGYDLYDKFTVDSLIAALSGGGMTNPMTTAGDIIKGGSSGTPQRLAIGSTGDVLTVVAGAPAWQAPASAGMATDASNAASVAVSSAWLPGTSNSIALGSTTKQWTNLFLGSSGSINFNNGSGVISNTSGAEITAAPADGTFRVWKSGVGATGQWINAAFSEGVQISAANNLIKSLAGAGLIMVNGASEPLGVGGSAGTNVKLDVVTTTMFGRPFPVMTTSQRNAISSPSAGVGVYCSDCTASDASTGVVTIYNGSTWKNMW